MVLLLGLTACDKHENIPSKPEVEDDLFEGDNRIIRIPEGLHHYNSFPFTCYLKAQDGSIFRRDGEIAYTDSIPSICLQRGIKDGIYQLLYLEHEIEKPTNEKYKKAHFGLGCNVKVEGGRSTVLNRYHSSARMYGSGTDEDPFIVSSYSHLIDITFAVEDGDETMCNAVYRQTADIDMDYASYRCDSNFGWMPIGTAANPFRGKYIGATREGKICTISNLWAKTREMHGVGFFGHLLDAKIDSLNIAYAEVKGDAAVGVVAGAVIQSGNKRVSSSISNCTVSDCVVSGFEELGKRNTIMIGGILGCVDLNSMALITSCKVDNTQISATINAGGVVGGTGLYTCLSINDCRTTASCKIISDYSGAGGMVGSCDTLMMNGCQNEAAIVGSRLYTPAESGTAGIGAGGLVGGSTISHITASINKGDVSGYTGVGGIIGSTRAAGSGTKTDPMYYNNTYLRYCGNEGNVSGQENVGGLCGEAQFGCYAGYNTGEVTGKGNYVSGGVGNTSLAVIHNTVNTGNISGKNFVGGLVSKTEFGSIAYSQNYGSVTAKNGSSHAGGICAIATNYSVFHHSGNFGKVSGYGNVGGIVGELGHADDVSGLTIATSVMVLVDFATGLFFGPTIGLVTKDVSGVLKRVLQITNVAAPLVFSGVDAALVIYPWTVHYDEKEWKTLSTEISNSMDKNMQDVISNISELRNADGRNFALYEGISQKVITDNYSDLMKDFHNYYITALMIL